MSRTGDSERAGRRHIDEEAKRTFLAALKQGVRVRAAAGEAGFSSSAFYAAREREPAFAEAWADALELSVLRKRVQGASAGVGRDKEGAPTLVAPHVGRRLQKRNSRSLRFTEKKQAVFLSYFAGSCNVLDAAEAAKVSVPTVYRYRAKDPVFAAGFAQALEQGYARLEAELVRQRVEAQRKLDEGILPEGEPAAEFERAVKLLARWERRGGVLGPAQYGHGKLKRWSFDEAMVALEKKLMAIGYRVDEGGTGPHPSPLPPAGEGGEG